MKTLRFKIEGASPLLMHDDKTANPLNEYSKKLKALTSKRKKTDDDLLEIARIEWEASLYYTKEKGYFIKGDCFAASFLEAAKSKKLGTAFKQSVIIPDDPVLVFPHMKLTPDKLFDKPQYVDMRTVKVMRNKVMRCRPIFNEWSCEVTVFFDESRLDELEIEQIVAHAAQYIGVCDYRPKVRTFHRREDLIMDAEKIQAAIVFHALYLNKCRERDGQVSGREETELAERAVRIVNVMNVDIEEPTE